MAQRYRYALSVSRPVKFRSTQVTTLVTYVLRKSDHATLIHMSPRILRPSAGVRANALWDNKK